MLRVLLMFLVLLTPAICLAVVSILMFMDILPFSWWALFCVIIGNILYYWFIFQTICVQ